ncbi:MAG: rRNA maturation RNase YbeY [Burkholderiales bacterium]
MRSDFSLSVQYASTAESLPTRPRFRKWVGAALQAPAKITIRIVDEEEGRNLNRDYRGRDYATNVLTFVYGESEGDIVICAPVLVKEALEQKKPLESHYAHMTVHGTLHLQGYDHESDGEAAIMESLEAAIMAKLGYADPYGV